MTKNALQVKWTSAMAHKHDRKGVPEGVGTDANAHEACLFPVDLEACLHPATVASEIGLVHEHPTGIREADGAQCCCALVEVVAEVPGQVR